MVMDVSAILYLGGDAFNLNYLSVFIKGFINIIMEFICNPYFNKLFKLFRMIFLKR